MSAFGSLDSLLPVEAVDEFRVHTSNAANDLGRLPGASIAITSRSGSNDFHGSIVYRVRHEIAAANGVTNRVTHLVYSHHHADHAGAAALFDGDVTRIGHEETRRLLLRDNSPARPVP